MSKFDNLVQVYEQPNMISNKHAIRIYTTSHNENEVRYHIGFPSNLLPDGVWLLAETEPYMGEKHWTEQDGFYLFWIGEVRNQGDALPFEKLQGHIVWMIGMIKKAVDFYNRASK